jgi:hypothetical protein
MNKVTELFGSSGRHGVRAYGEFKKANGNSVFARLQTLLTVLNRF